jgi:hypothetical protein
MVLKFGASFPSSHIKPLKYLGEINGQYIYTYQSADVLPTIITYGHISASEGGLSTYVANKGMYQRFGGEYWIDAQRQISPVSKRSVFGRTGSLCSLTGGEASGNEVFDQRAIRAAARQSQKRLSSLAGSG